MNTSFSNNSIVPGSIGDMDQLADIIRMAFRDAATQASNALHTHAGVELRPETAAVFSAVALFVAACLLGLGLRATKLLTLRQRRRDNALAVRIAQDAPEDDRDEHEYETRDDVRAAAPGDSDGEDDVVVKRQVQKSP